jgi:hypothetical protein
VRWTFCELAEKHSQGSCQDRDGSDAPVAARKNSETAIFFVIYAIYM